MLRRKALPVINIDSAKPIIERLRTALDKSPLMIGLSAPQIGSNSYNSLLT